MTVKQLLVGGLLGVGAFGSMMHRLPRTLAATRSTAPAVTQKSSVRPPRLSKSQSRNERVSYAQLFGK